MPYPEQNSQLQNNHSRVPYLAVARHGTKVHNGGNARVSR
jgi:hypothetical protein